MRIITSILFISISLITTAQDFCKRCEDLKYSSRTEYNGAAAQQYDAECILRDTVFLNDNLQVKMKNESTKYTVFTKDKCQTYFSTATYTFSPKEKLMEGYEVENSDTSFYIVDNTEEHVKKVVSKAYSFISNNIEYPHILRDNGVQGVVYLKFSINSQGKLSGVYPLKEANSLFIKEAIRVIKLVPEWPVATYHGKRVRSSYNMPIRFKL